MIKKNEINSIVTRLVPQNVILVLLATTFCFFAGFFYCLSLPPVYIAKVQVFIKNSEGNSLTEDERNRAVSLLMSPLIYRETVTALEKQNTPVTLQALQNFYSQVFVKADADHIFVRFADHNATYAHVILENLINVFQKQVNNTYPTHQLTIIEDSRKKRNAQLSSVLNDFGRSINGENQERGESNLYAALIAAIGNRIAYDASLAVLKNIYDTQQSPLNLEFIANDTAVFVISTQLNKLTSEIAHMQTQLGADHPQIKAMLAEKNALTAELDKKVNLAVKRLYTEAEIAHKTEIGLREEWTKIDVANQKNHDQWLRELEKKLHTIWQEYDHAVENAISLKDNKIHITNGPIMVSKQKIFARFGKNLAAFTLLALFLFFIIALLFKKIPSVKDVDAANDTDAANSNAVALKPDDPAVETTKIQDPLPTKKPCIGFEQLLPALDEIKAQLVAVVGANAGQTSARLAMSLKHENKTVLLIDISTNEIGNLIGPHRGFTDVLTGDAKISEVIYSDYDTGIDILPQGMASPLRAKDFVSDIPELAHSLKEKYSVILMAIAIEPKFGVGEIFGNCDCVVISTDENNDEDVWRDLFSKYSKGSLFILAENK